MPSKVYSISLPEDLAEFIDTDPDLSLSKIAQVSVRRLMEDRRDNPLVMRLRAQNAKLAEELAKANVALEQKTG